MGKWECKLKAIEYYELVKKEIKKEPSFEDLIRNRIVSTSVSEVKNNFEFYRLGWNLIDKDTSNSSDIYYEYITSQEKHPRTQEEVYAENDAIIESITEHPYNTNVMYEDEMSTLPKTEYINCSDCGRVFKSFEEYGKCDKCSLKAKKVEENKKLKPFTFNSFLYVLIGFGILYFLFSLDYTTFLFVGGIGLFTLLYFLDAKK